jgi:hypothetical protein
VAAGVGEGGEGEGGIEVGVREIITESGDMTGRLLGLEGYLGPQSSHHQIRHVRWLYPQPMPVVSTCMMHDCSIGYRECYRECYRVEQAFSLGEGV